jgi:hypothetical protein
MYRFLAIPRRLKYKQVILIAIRTDGSETRRLKCKGKLDTVLCYTLCYEDTWRNNNTIPSTFTLALEVYDQICASVAFSQRKSYQKNDLGKKPTRKRTLGM